MKKLSFVSGDVSSDSEKLCEKDVFICNVKGEEFADRFEAETESHSRVDLHEPIPVMFYQFYTI